MKKLVITLALATAAAAGYYLDVLTRPPLICPTTERTSIVAPSPAPESALHYSPHELYACWWGAWSQTEAHCGTITT